jgi:hypothetical protein
MQFTNEKTWKVHTSEDVDETSLQKVLKLVFLCLEPKANMMLHVNECCSQCGSEG